MRKPVGRQGLILLPLLLTAAAPPEDVDAVLALTRTTKATYAVCTWNVVTPSEEVQLKEWAAEYHQGDRHRVETPRDRIVANCATGEAQHLDVRTGEVSTSPSLAPLPVASTPTASWSPRNFWDGRPAASMARFRASRSPMTAICAPMMCSTTARSSQRRSMMPMVTRPNG
ncbi:hypothetical protein ACFSUK_24675 [Sphingobium scionense]